jgi:hypothetical protein
VRDRGGQGKAPPEGWFRGRGRSVAEIIAADAGVIIGSVLIKAQPQALAVAEGYVYIIDKQAAQGTYIFLNDNLNEDVTNKVAAKLGITLAAPAPARPVAAQ